MDSKFLTHLLQGKIVELFPIINDNRVWDSKLVDDVSLDEVCAFCLNDRQEWFGFYLFGEVIDYHDGELSLCPSGGERVDLVYPLFCEWPGTDNGRKRLSRMSWDMGEPLALVTFLNEVRRILLHGWPIEPLLEGFLSQALLP